MSNAIVANGREEAARANQLSERQEEAAAAVRQRYRSRLTSVSGLRRLVEWVKMRKEIRKVRREVEQELAPDDAQYVRQRQHGADEQR